jgi:hypothetical protein
MESKQSTEVVKPVEIYTHMYVPLEWRSYAVRRVLDITGSRIHLLWVVR